MQRTPHEAYAELRRINSVPELVAWFADFTKESYERMAAQQAWMVQQAKRGRWELFLHGIDAPADGWDWDTAALCIDLYERRLTEVLHASEVTV